MKINGINLGGWFVLERWIKPSLFEDIEGKDETKFVTLVDNAKTKLEKHWKTWITEKDFKNIQKQGFNLVRIPIPYWLFGDIPPYYGCIVYLDQAMNWAEKYHLNVMLDLHTAPGSQNGFDNGGVEGVMEWHKDIANIQETVMILGKIAKRYGSHNALHSIQVLNEPFLTIDINIVKNFYIDAYYEIRQYLPDSKSIVFHDSFRMHEWDTFFQDNNFINCILDTHQYQCFDENHIQFSPEEHICFALNEKKQVLDQLQSKVPIIIGEWSLGVRETDKFKMSIKQKNRFLSLYYHAQKYAFENTCGSIFWTYKVEQDRLGWNYSKLWSKGIINEEKN